MHEWLQSVTETITVGLNLKYSKKDVNELGSKPGLRGKKTASNRLNHGTFCLLIITKQVMKKIS
jgi:hypothetical protein